MAVGMAKRMEDASVGHMPQTAFRLPKLAASPFELDIASVFPALTMPHSTTSIRPTDPRI
jgi:hypothetical protein